MPAPIPLLKIGGLLIRTLSKPLANQMKSWVKTNEPFANFCCYIGQQTHQVLSILNIRAAGLKVVSVKPLPREEAVADGVGYASEVFVFSVATPNHHRCCHHRCCQDSQWVQEGFSRTSGQPLPQAWSPDTGTFNEKGRTESTALHAALNATSAATFVACVADHVSAAASSSSSALLSHNYIRDVVGACHKYG
jgi:hypothetical protein